MLSPPLICRVCYSFSWSENYKKMHSDPTVWLRVQCHVTVEFYVFSTTSIFSRANLFQECLSSIWNILVRTLTTWKLAATRQNWNIRHYFQPQADAWWPPTRRNWWMAGKCQSPVDTGLIGKSSSKISNLNINRILTFHKRIYFGCITSLSWQGDILDLVDTNLVC